MERTIVRVPTSERRCIGCEMIAARISVIVPCYNAARYVGAALRSVLAQEGERLELIVVDDGSSDGSADLVVQGFPGVTLLRQTNQGAAAARNLGVRHASGEWIAFLDADDLWLPGKIAAQWRAIDTKDAPRLVYTAWQEWTGEAVEPVPDDLASLLIGVDEPDNWRGPSGWIYPQLLLDCAVWTSTVMLHRSLFEEIGFFDTWLQVGEDYDFWLRASRVTAMVRVSRPYALYRKHPQSLTKSAPAANYRGIVIERALSRWGFIGPDGAQANASHVRRALAQSWSDCAWAHLQAGDLRPAREASLHAMRVDWRHALGWKLLARAWLRSLLRCKAARAHTS